MSKSQQNPTEPVPPFHRLKLKASGERVRTPRFPTDESRGYYYGTVLPGGDVEWDELVPHLGKRSSVIPAMSLYETR
jgi:hypothetical protein